MPELSERAVLDALRPIQDPDFRRSIVDLGFVKDLSIDGGRVAFTIELTTPACPVKEQFQQAARDAVGALAGVTSVEVQMTANTRGSPRTAQSAELLPGVKNTVAVASGKGGVGKSTVALNLALALADRGEAVGLLDADVYGPNIPLMVGLTRREWTEDWTLARRTATGAQPTLAPIERYGIEIVSAGFILGEDQPMGLDANAIDLLIRQLVQQTRWGELDILVVDLPPGTADVLQILLRQIRFSGVVMVVTPQDVAHLDAKKALGKFRQAQVRVLGAVENMSGLRCPHCGEMFDVFPRVSESRSLWSAGVECLGAIPLDPALGRAGDTGRPLLARDGSAQAAAFGRIADRVTAKLREDGT
ncbi:MAG: P-loop NTPase [Candidatus Limnocylindria bacterium]